MNVTTTKGRALAIAAGLAFTAGGLTILLGEALTRPHEWSSYQWLTILTVFGTIAAGHLMADAGRARHVFATLGFLSLFLAGTGLVVYSSVGRQVEAAGATMLSAEDTNAKIIEKQADLAKAKQRFDEATQYGDDEMKGETCGRRCKDWRQRAKEVQALISQIEGEIAALGPQKPVNAQAAAMADIAALFGFDNKARTVGALTLILPFLKTLFFEIGSIVSLGFAFRHGPAKPSEPAKAADHPAIDVAGQSDFPAVSESSAKAMRSLFDAKIPEHSATIVRFPSPDNPPNGSGPKPGKRANGRKADVLADIVARIENGERFESQEELRALLSERFGHISRSTLSDWLSELSGVTRHQEGRRKIVG